MADLLFLGTGGGRINLIRQRRGTGGFLILGSDLAIHVDPGPGALSSMLRHGQDPLSTDAIIVSHSHIDHVHDAPLMIEAMTKFMLERRGVLIASKSVLEGDEHGDRTVTRYHQSMLEKKITMLPGKVEEVAFSKKSKGDEISASFSITGTPVKHEDPEGFGFVLELDGARVGYTSDTEYFEGLSGHFKGCDVLIANNIKPADDPYPGHLNSAACARLFSEAAPKYGIITHFGMKIINSGPEAEAQKIAKASGIDVFAAREGMYFCTDRCGWFKAEPTPNGKSQKSLFENEENGN